MAVEALPPHITMASADMILNVLDKKIRVPTGTAYIQLKHPLRWNRGGLE